jgi:DNA-directed RNA polymerase specialized sigma24 family protein
MEEERRHVWGRALVDARTYLGHWSDAFTRCSRDDLAQEAAFAVWRYAASPSGVGRLAGLVRTVSRRMRVKALLQLRRDICCVAEGDLDHLPAPGEDADCLRVRGEPVPRDWLVARLDVVMGCLTLLNRRLVLAFYEGFSCSELSERFGLSQDAVKVRLHRCRRLLRRRLEAEARAAGHFET